MAIIGDEDGGCARIAITLHFLICCSLFAYLQMSAHFRILFQPCSSLGTVSTTKFFFKSAVKDGADLKKNTSRPQLHVQDRSSRWITYYCFRQGSICDSKIIFRCATRFSSAPCALKNFWKGKSTRMLVRRWKGSFDQDAS